MRSSGASGLTGRTLPLLMRERLSKHEILSFARLGSRFRGNDG